ncbi:MAG: Ppx/GppA phosphatase family protein [Bacillota bacterium]|jgi:exopolyphosphatase/guanosine-5'-triphosphate,3'-diphosphate pyrophosphatase|nr:Ppx/GppA phosphatase family protein [Bacillota bacterium]HHU43238.1 Ppx/GppA family phosphatase [Clostridiales bacterium]
MEKIAIIDIGSNMTRLVIAKILDGGYFVVIDELKEPVRLAQDMEIDGFLRPLRVQQMIKTLNTFKKLYESHGVNKMFAYGTAAVRRAKNQKNFVDEVLSQCGIKLTVLSQHEEASLVYTGVINSMDVPKGLIVDIGGGSVKIIYYNRRTLIAQDTLPFGAVTLTEKFQNKSKDPAERVQMIEEYVAEEVKKLGWFDMIDEDTKLIGAGGSMRNLGKISRKFKRYPLDMAHNYTVSFKEFDTIYQKVKVLEIDKAARIKGLSSARVDIFPAALAILNTLNKTLNFDEIRISGAGFREGVMFRYSVPSTAEKPISDVLGHSIYTMLSHFNMNVPHSEHVFDLSLQLYRQLKVLHKLPRNYIKILRVAAQLHDIGSSFKFYDHPRHSFYLILHSNLYGIPQKDLVIAAIAAGLHAKTPLEGMEVEQYLTMLNAEEIDAAKKLGVIVRIAECFDRSMGRVIKGISCDVLGDSVILKTECDSDCTLEIKDAMSAVLDFRRAFRKNLEIL